LGYALDWQSGRPLGEEALKPRGNLGGSRCHAEILPGNVSTTEDVSGTRRCVQRCPIGALTIVMIKTATGLCFGHRPSEDGAHNIECPHCHVMLRPAEYMRLDSERLCCLKCRQEFVYEGKGGSYPEIR
jgi:hypothetical protein